jgi:succinate dehydrogenase/fumarate reductase cytochrome b subunit (b558 family)
MPRRSPAYPEASSTSGAPSHAFWIFAHASPDCVVEAKNATGGCDCRDEQADARAQGGTQARSARERTRAYLAAGARVRGRVGRFLDGTSAVSYSNIVLVTTRLQRIFSLSGVIPLGLFLTLHLVVCSAALFGRPVFVAAVGQLSGAAVVRVAEVAVVLVPLAVHSGIGVWLVATRRSLPGRPYSPAMSRAMRVTGIAVLAFVVWHAWALRVRGAGADPEELYSRLAESLSSTAWPSSASPEWRGVPLVALAYLAGVAVTVFHFAAGLWAFGASWRGARAGWACAALGAALLFLGANTVVCFATGSRFFAPGEYTPVDVEPKSTPCPP